MAGRSSFDDQPAKRQKACTQTNKHYKSKQRRLCPDSGATSNMFTHENNFGDDYRKCKDVVVYMGDGTRVCVDGYGTARIKLNGKVQVLPKSLHVPGLDCSLLSITRHGHQKGCTFFTGDGNWHLTFPRFSMETPLTENGDLQIKMEELTSEDCLCDDFTYGVDDIDHADHLDIFARRLKALNQIHRGRAVTQAQSKKQLDRLTSHLQSTTKHDSCDDKRDDENLDYNKLEDELQSAFDHFGEKHLEDISDDETVCADNQEDEDFTKTDTKPPPQYHLESSRGATKDRLTRHTLQFYFGGRQLKDYKILADLGTGLLVIDNKNEIPTVGSLVNHKRGKRKRKGTPASSPLVVVGMDI